MFKSEKRKFRQARWLVEEANMLVISAEHNISLANQQKESARLKLERVDEILREAGVLNVA